MHPNFNEIRALAKYLRIAENLITKLDETHYGLNMYSCTNSYRDVRGVYAVANGNSERIRALNEAVIDFVNREIIRDEAYREFFDYDACAHAAIVDGDVGSYLAFYDCHEDTVNLYENTYYIYKVERV